MGKVSDSAAVPNDLVASHRLKKKSSTIEMMA